MGGKKQQRVYINEMNSSTNKNHDFHTAGHLWTACNHIPLSFSFNLDSAETDALDSEGNEISIPVDDSTRLLSGALLL